MHLVLHTKFALSLCGTSQICAKPKHVVQGDVCCDFHVLLVNIRIVNGTFPFVEQGYKRSLNN